MSRRRRQPRPALLVRVLAHLGGGHIREDYIIDRNDFVSGETLGGRITINPAIDVVNTVVHEILHALEPDWHENYVRRTTTFLLRRMSDEQIQAVYDEYQRVVRRRKKRDRKRGGVHGEGQRDEGGVRLGDGAGRDERED